METSKKFRSNPTTYVTEEGEFIDNKDLNDLIYKKVETYTKTINHGTEIKINRTTVIKVYGRQLSLFGNENTGD